MLTRMRLHFHLDHLKLDEAQSHFVDGNPCANRSKSFCSHWTLLFLTFFPMQM